MQIRKFVSETDYDALRECAILLQDFERGLDPRTPSGASIVDAYIQALQSKCGDCSGQIFVATIDETIVGYMTILGQVVSEDLDDGGLTYALVEDLFVHQTFRGQGVAKRLLSQAEEFAKSHDAKWLRLSVFARNSAARAVYESMGFAQLYLDYEKALD